MRHPIFALLCVLALGSVVPACLGEAPAPVAPRAEGPLVIHVWIDPLFAAEHVAEITDELRRMGRLGPSFCLVRDERAADVRLAAAVTDCATGRHHDAVRRIAFVDRYCAPSPRAFRAMVGHELSAALGLSIVCRDEGKTSCSPVGRGVAMMNEPPAPDVGTEADWQDEPTDLDIAEFARTMGE